MEKLDLFKDWTPEMIASRMYQGSGCRTKERWAGMSSEEKEAYLKNSLHSKKGIEKNIETHRSESFKRSHREKIRKYRNSLSLEEKTAHDKRSGEGVKRYWDSMSIEEVEARNESVSRGVKSYWEGLSSEEKALHGKIMSRTMGQYWKGLTPEEKSEKLDNSFNSNEAKRGAAEASRTREGRERRRRTRIEVMQKGFWSPNRSEFLLGYFLEKSFPGLFRYNRMEVGGKIPDFIGTNGRKIIIELFGSYWHDPLVFPNRLSEEELVAHYKSCGYDCLIIWEYELIEEGVVSKVAKILQGIDTAELI